MRRRILLMISAAMFAVSALSLTSCTKEENGEMGSASMTVEEIDVHPNDWRWNDNLGRYEAFKRTNMIDWRMFNRGTVTAGLFLTEGNTETLKSLPFIEPFNNSLNLTSTISFDISIGEIAFYYQLSDGTRPVGFPYGGMTFKVSYFWDEYM